MRTGELQGREMRFHPWGRDQVRGFYLYEILPEEVLPNPLDGLPAADEVILAFLFHAFQRGDLWAGKSGVIGSGSVDVMPLFDAVPTCRVFEIFVGVLQR